MTTHFDFSPHAYDLPLYGTEPERSFESFPAYLERVFLPVVQLIPALYTVRCSVSGFPSATLTQDEVTACFKAVCIKLNLDRYDTLLDLPSRDRVIEVCSAIEDEMMIRLVIMSRPAPSLTKNDGRFVIQDLDPNRQLSILLNQLLWDTGMFRASKQSDDLILHHQRLFDAADRIKAEQVAHTPEGIECLAALIELDAMYRINELRLSRKESDRLIAIRNKAELSFAEVKQFALQLLIQREKTMTPEIMPMRWTQLAFRNQVFQAASREDKSNLLEGMRKAAMPSNAHIKKPVHSAKPAAESKPAKPRTEAQIQQDEIKARLKALMSGGMNFNL